MNELIILQQTEIAGHSVFLIPGLVIGVLMIVFIVMYPESKFKAKEAIFCLVVFIILLGAVCCAPRESTGRYTYDVEITDNTDLQYIYDNYNIIERGYRVWTIQDRE